MRKLQKRNEFGARKAHRKRCSLLSYGIEAIMSF
jgi:hypothetical protein